MFNDIRISAYIRGDHRKLCACGLKECIWQAIGKRWKNKNIECREIRARGYRVGNKCNVVFYFQRFGFFLELREIRAGPDQEKVDRRRALRVPLAEGVFERRKCLQQIPMTLVIRKFSDRADDDAPAKFRFEQL